MTLGASYIVILEHSKNNSQHSSLPFYKYLIKMDQSLLFKNDKNKKNHLTDFYKPSALIASVCLIIDRKTILRDLSISDTKKY